MKYDFVQKPYLEHETYLTLDIYFMLKKIQLEALGHIRKNSQGPYSKTTYPVTVNFHPDSYTNGGTPVLQALKADGRLKSQFETGTSNGGLSAFVGGNRWLWEQKAFAGIYDNAPPQLRPIYGGLNITRSDVGASSRFGSSHFRLKQEVLERTSFCYPDSYLNPNDFATIEAIEPLVELAKASNLDMLDNYIEAHIHGGIQLDRDVEALVLDPSFKGTEIEALANTLPCKLEWHHGFTLQVAALSQHQNYRGREIVELAQVLAGSTGTLTPSSLTTACTQDTYHPQAIKKVWHYIARFGSHH